MKTLILKLEPHDDVISVKDKMGWGKTNRILLVWPAGSPILSRHLDLIILQRYSTNIGAQLALVTRNADIHSNGRQLSIPVFNTIQQAQRSNWRTRRRNRLTPLSTSIHLSSAASNLRARREQINPATPAWLTLPVTRLSLFTFGVLGLLALAAVLVPSAKITLKPKIETRELTLTIQASSQFDSIKLTGAIPAHKIPVIVEGSKTIPVTGNIQIPNQPASGEVLVTNLTDKTILIPVGLVVRTTGNVPIRFQITKSGEIPTGVGQAITLTVQALEPGKTGNLNSNSLVAIENPLGIDISVTNPNPTHGGTEQTSRVPTDNDRNSLYSLLEGSLISTARQEFLSSLKSIDQPLSAEPVSSRVLEKTYNPGENTPSDQLELNLRMEFQFLVADGKDILTLAQSISTANLPDGYRIMPGIPAITNLSKPKMVTDAIAEWQIQIQQKIQIQLDKNLVVNQSISLPLTKVQHQLVTSLPLDAPPIVSVSPPWWPRMPILPFRIQVITISSG